MKTARLTLAALGLVVAASASAAGLAAAGPARADQLAAGDEPTTLVYTGVGHAYDAQRKPDGDYTLEVRVTPTSATDEAVTVRIVKADGTVSDESCTMQRNDVHDRWHKVCAGGEGWGYFFDFGMGSEFYEAKDGLAYVTQIIVDSPSKMRFLRTELAGGNRVTRYFAEELTKQ